MIFYENEEKNEAMKSENNVKNNNSSDNENDSENENENNGEGQNGQSGDQAGDGSVTVTKDGKRIHCMTIIGQIEGHYPLGSGQKATQYEHVLPTLVSVEEDDEVSGLLILLNTVGGDVEAGLAISEMIASMKKPSVSLVLGGGHSIGVPLAVSAKKSFIVPTATMTIHPVRISGTVIGAPQTFRYFADMQNRITEFVAGHSKISRERFGELLMRSDEMAADIGTILEGRQAVEEGLIDSLGGLSDALAALSEMSRE